MTILQILQTYRPAFEAGLLTTLRLCGAIWAAGLVLGGTLGVFAHRLPRAVGLAASVGSFFMGSVPILVFLYWLHFPLAEMGLQLEPFWSAAIALSVVNLLAVSDIVRQALAAFPQELVVAGRVSGLSGAQTLRYIQLPLLMRQLLPPLINAQVAALQATLFASLISVDELFRTAQNINARIYQPIQVYTALGLFFLVVCGLIQGATLFLKRRFGRNLSEMPAR